MADVHICPECGKPITPGKEHWLKKGRRDVAYCGKCRSEVLQII